MDNPRFLWGTMIVFTQKRLQKRCNLCNLPLYSTGIDCSYDPHQLGYSLHTHGYVHLYAHMCLFHLLNHDWLENAKLAIWEKMGKYGKTHRSKWR